MAGPPTHRRWLWRILTGIAIIAIAITGLWGSLALLHQAPGGAVLQGLAAGVWGIAAFIALAAQFTRHRARAVMAYIVAFALLLFWWGTVLPSNDRDWADDVAEMTTGTVDGSSVTLSNVRNFQWRTVTDFTPRWETRQVDLDRLTSVDLLLSYWSSPAIAHTLVSFGFDDGSFVTFSVEIRKERHESFSEIGGFFKEFETSVIAADERDIVQVRTSVRKEDVYLYRINMPKPAIRSLFLSYIETANDLAREPRFYNTITANCTTIVYDMVRRIVPGLPMNYRLSCPAFSPNTFSRRTASRPALRSPTCVPAAPSASAPAMPATRRTSPA